MLKIPGAKKTGIKRNMILPILLTAGFISVPSSGQTPDRDTSRQAFDPIAIANEYTGFDKSESFSKAAIRCDKIMGPVADKTPFLHDKIANQPLWRIIYPDIKVGRGDTYVKRDFEVFLDTSGKLLRIYSISDIAGSSDTLPEPAATAAEKYLYNVRFLGIPDSIPPISFLKALESIVDNPARVKVIRGMYYDYKVDHPRDTSKGAVYSNNWIIIARGSENIFPSSGRSTTPIPDAHLNSHWSVVDGKSGKLIMFTNAPYDRTLFNSKAKDTKE